LREGSRWHSKYRTLPLRWRPLVDRSLSAAETIRWSECEILRYRTEPGGPVVASAKQDPDRLPRVPLVVYFDDGAHP